VSAAIAAAGVGMRLERRAMRTLGRGRGNTEDDGIEKQARKGTTKEDFLKGVREMLPLGGFGR
jgi:hypothetical protein